MTSFDMTRHCVQDEKPNPQFQVSVQPFAQESVPGVTGSRPFLRSCIAVLALVSFIGWSALCPQDIPSAGMGLVDSLLQPGHAADSHEVAQQYTGQPEDAAVNCCSRFAGLAFPAHDELTPVAQASDPTDWVAWAPAVLEEVEFFSSSSSPRFLQSTTATVTGRWLAFFIWPAAPPA
ncbi:MAG: hypothetical protein R3348_05255 [Xanthomonadales bacterium]|nr:hypothetical protein [Xanthomonadales bacterium]